MGLFSKKTKKRRFLPTVTNSTSSRELAPSNTDSDLVISNGGRGGQMVKVRAKEIQVGGKLRNLDPYQLMGMIKSVTLTIGEYKRLDNAYSDFVLRGLRESRRNMISTLEEHFRIHWSVAENGDSQFYM